MTEGERIRGLIQRRIDGMEDMACRDQNEGRRGNQWTIAASVLRGLLREIDAGVLPDDIEELRALFADD